MYHTVIKIHHSHDSKRKSWKNESYWMARMPIASEAKLCVPPSIFSLLHFAEAQQAVQPYSWDLVSMKTPKSRMRWFAVFTAHPCESQLCCGHGKPPHSKFTRVSFCLNDTVATWATCHTKSGKKSPCLFQLKRGLGSNALEVRVTWQTSGDQRTTKQFEQFVEILSNCLLYLFTEQLQRIKINLTWLVLKR